jgi:hypothetical protein
MFEDMVVSGASSVKTNKPWTVVLSMVAQVLFLGILILIPLIYTEALPKTMMSTLLVAPPPPPPPPPPPVAAQIVKVKPQVHLMDAGKLVAPKVIPKDVKIIKEEAPDMNAGMAGGVPGGVAGGSMGGVIGGVIGGMGGAPPPPKPVASRIRQGGSVVDQPSSAGLPAAGAPDAHCRHRTSARPDFQAGHGGVAGSSLRASAPRSRGDGCRTTVEIQANAVERRTGGSRYHDRRDFLSESVEQ